MESVLNLNFRMLFFVCSLFIYNKSEAQINPNTNKVELIYKNVNVSSTSSSGSTYSYTSGIPRIRINDGELKDYDAKEMLSIFKDCPQANKEVLLYIKNKKKASNYFWGGLLIGSGLIFGGVLGEATLEGSNASGAAFGTGFGLGMTTFIYGIVKSRKHGNRINSNLENSVRNYNLHCYKSQIDSTLVLNSEMKEENSKKTKSNQQDINLGIIHDYKDNIGYSLLKSDPDHVRFWALGISPVIFEFAANRGFNLYFLIDAIIQLGSKISFKTELRRAYVDNFSEASFRNTYLNFGEPKFISTDYRPAFRTDFITSIEFKGNTRMTEYSAKLGNEKMEGLYVENYGSFNAKERKSYNLRGGFSYENAIYFSEQNLPIESSVTNLKYTDPGNGISYPVPIDNMGGAMPMVKSNCISLGVSRKKIYDYQIELSNSTKYKGKRNYFGYTELFIDMMYGVSLESGNVAYQYQSVNTGHSEPLMSAPLSTDLTKFNKIGWKIGYNLNHNKLSGGIEIGARPGIAKLRGYVTFNSFYRFGSRF